MEKTKIMRFDKMVDALVKYHKKAIARPKDKREYKYEGYELTSNSILATTLPITKQLSKDEIEYQIENNGRTPIEIQLTCAVQLGIQQGINMCSEKPIMYLESEQQKSLNQKLGEYITKHLNADKI